MKMSDMLMKKWYKVQIIAKSKQFKVTKQVFNTKTEGIEKGISKGYEILNYKALSKLLSEGYTEYQAKEENVTTEATHSENVKEVKQEQTEVKKAKIDPIKLFLASPPRQKSYKPFNYSKSWESYESKGRPRAERELNKQIAEYR